MSRAAHKVSGAGTLHEHFINVEPVNCDDANRSTVWHQNPIDVELTQGCGGKRQLAAQLLV